MREYTREMNQRALEAKEMALREAQIAATMPMSMNPSIPPPSINPMPDILSSSANSSSPTTRRADPAAPLDDEEGKRSLITNEIQMFRDRFKDEETKMRNTEKERKDRYERERVAQREKRPVDETSASGNNKSSVSPPPSSRDRSSHRHDRNSSSRNNTSNSVRSRTNDRRNSPSSRYDRRSPRSYNRRSRTKSPLPRPDEDDDEAYERKKQERRLREKEIRYRDVR
jgi:RNA-binding protein 25